MQTVPAGDYLRAHFYVTELYLALNAIEHRRTKVKKPQTNGFVERFQKTVGEEFFAEVLDEKKSDAA